MAQSINFKLEDNINDWVKSEFKRIKQNKYTIEGAMSACLKDAIQQGVKIKRFELEEAGEKEKGKSWKPDFHLEAFDIPVLIENKLGITKLSAMNGNKVKNDIKSVKDFAVNGAIHYAQCAIMSKKYKEVIAIGISGDNLDNIKIQVYYVFGATDESYKFIENVKTLDFLENEATFSEFYKKATLSEDEKHDILIRSQAELQKYAKSLNKLMNNLNITSAQRVLYVSGMLLSMQDIKNTKGDTIEYGLVPDDLKGTQTDSNRDGVKIVNKIEEYLKAREIPLDKQKIMLSSFSEISKAPLRDELTELDKEISKLIKEQKASTNKQIFTFIYNNIYLSIDSMEGHLDIMGEMYSEFLKYALSDGKNLGIVLTPPYITKMMVSILNINKESRVMDLATGSAGFLISAMEMMIEDVENMYGKNATESKNKIIEIKRNQLLGVELNAEMFTLAATNMILRGDGSSNIQIGDSFKTPDSLYTNFKANKLLLNPPFSYTENGMPFIAFGLDRMELGGLAAIIIQDSAGSGKAVSTNKQILKKHTLVASIKMPTDLFQPMAGVQTSIYIVEAHKPHDAEKTVKFIDFRNDGYKRTSRALQEIDEPTKRYSDIVKIYKAGNNAKVEANWKLGEIYIEDFITSSGADWNFDQHKVIDTKPTLTDFKKTVGDYLSWEVSNILKNQNNQNEDLGK